MTQSKLLVIVTVTIGGIFPFIIHSFNNNILPLRLSIDDCVCLSGTMSCAHQGSYVVNDIHTFPIGVYQARPEGHNPHQHTYIYFTGTAL